MCCTGDAAGVADAIPVGTPTTATGMEAAVGARGIDSLTSPVIIYMSGPDPEMAMSERFHPFSFASVHASGDATNLPSDPPPPAAAA